MADEETSAVKRIDPFGEFDLFRSFPGSWARMPSLLSRLEEGPARSAPSVDITEDEGRYVVTAELPGAKKEDVTVEVHDGVLTLRGEKRSEREEKNERRRYVERTYGSFSRSFSLPADADPDRVDASIADGVLTVEIGKSEAAKPKTIAVK